MRETLLMLVPAIVLVALFVWLMRELGKRPSPLRQLERELGDYPWLGAQPQRALRFRLPVYSAETVQGKEAEFIRDRLPIKGRKVLMMLALLMLVLALFLAFMQ